MAAKSDEEKAEAAAQKAASVELDALLEVYAETPWSDISDEDQGRLKALADVTGYDVDAYFVSDQEPDDA